MYQLIETIGLLIHLIRLGPVEACADLAHGVALDTAASDYDRIDAIRALFACGWNDSVRELAGAMVAEPTSWPDELVHGIAPDLFPKIITTDELVRLMERTREPKQAIGGFEWTSRQIVESIESGADSAIALRDRMVDLIMRGCPQTLDPHCIQSGFGHLAPALAMLCHRQLSAATEKPDADLIRASVIASRFGADETGESEPVGKLRMHFTGDAALRSDGFWAELAFMDEVNPSVNDWLRLHYAEQGGIAGHLTEADRPWLKAALADEHRPERRAVALHALIGGWERRGRVAAELDAIRASLKGHTLLGRILEESTTPQKPNEALERMKREHQRRECERARDEAQCLEDWKTWRDELLEDPDGAFSEVKRQGTVSNLYKWLGSTERTRARCNKWDKDALMRAFGQDITDRAEKAFRALWRANPPMLWSARPVDEKHSIRSAWAHGLTGISAEAATPGWTASLSRSEARTAAAYTTIELNGFAPFITDLAKSHPAEVEDVIGGEVSSELSVGADHHNLPTLRNLAYSDGDLRRTFAPRLLAILKSWPTNFTADTGPRWSDHLDKALRILSAATDDADRMTIVRECAGRYEAEPLGLLALVWLRGLFQFDAVRGAQVLIREIEGGRDAGSADRAIEMFAALFNRRDAVAFEVEDQAQRARLLEQLVRYAYAFVRREDDQVHEGAYTPNTRDHAEEARNLLLSMLLDTPGPDAQRALLKLADEDDFAHFADYLRFQARQRAALDAEFPPFDSSDVVALDTRHEAPPRDSNGLFRLMMDRLDDLAHDLAHDDFTNRATLKGVGAEPEMQRNLAREIRQRANGAYAVTREEEVADAKRTDIRLSVPNRDLKGVIEVKIADKCSGADLVRALGNQLAGQYLRHSICRAGCLLLTYHGDKQYWIHPEDETRMPFPKLVAFLKDKARDIENESTHGVRIAVFDLDLTDPVLPHASPGES